MSHHCNALVLSCMDFRMHKTLHKWMEDKYDSFDVVHLAGGARTLIQPETAEIMLGQIALSARLHAIKTVVLVNHWDCGAYGGSAGFDNDETKERAQYTKDLQTAAQAVRRELPELTVVTVIEELNGEITKVL